MTLLRLLGGNGTENERERKDRWDGAFANDELRPSAVLFPTSLFARVALNAMLGNVDYFLPNATERGLPQRYTSRKRFVGREHITLYTTRRRAPKSGRPDLLGGILRRMRPTRERVQERNELSGGAVRRRSVICS